MKLDGIGSGGSPLADFLRSRVERILAEFQAGVAPAGPPPHRGAGERFLLALDDLAAATDGPGAAAQAAPGPGERTGAPALGAGDEPLAAEGRQGASPYREVGSLAAVWPRALERRVAFDVGAAVIARPTGEPLVDVFAKSDCPEATLALVRARALALYRQVAGGVQSSTADEGAAAASVLRSSMYFPLATEGAVVGLTYLAAFHPDAFSPADEQVLAALAKNASGAYRRLEASVHRLRLSPRQSQVLALIASGLSDKEGASRLGLAHRTVRTHVDRMLREHGLRSRTEAVAAWPRGRQG